MHSPSGGTPEQRLQPVAMPRASRYEQLRRVQVDMLFAQLPQALGASLLNAAILALVSLGAVGRDRALGWLGVLISLSVARTALWMIFRRSGQAGPVRTWHNLYRAGAVASGVVWGAASFVLLPGNDPAYAALLGMVIAGTASGAAASMSACHSTFMSFLLPMVGLYALGLALHKDQFLDVMALFAVLFIAATWVTSRKTHASTLDALRLRFENLDLLDDLKELHDATPVGIFRLNEAGQCIAISEGMTRITGLPSSEVLGDAWQLHVHSADHERVQAEVEQGRKAQHAFKTECRLLAADGRTIWTIVQGTPEFEEDGKFAGYAGTVTDITELKQAEEALRESEERFRRFMDNSPTIAWIKDEQGRYTYMNRSFSDHIGGRTNGDALWQDGQVPQWRSNDLAVLAAGHPIEFNEHTVASDGSLCQWLSIKFPLTDTSGNRFVAGIALDITARKQAEELLARSNSELEALVAQRTAELHKELQARAAAQAALAKTEKLEALTRLTGGLAHDFNNQLQVIIGSLKLFVSKSKAGEVDPLLDDALSAARTAAGLTERLLPTGAGALEPVTLDVNRNIARLAPLLQRTVGPRIGVALDLESGINAVRIDPREFETAILNLTLNARDAMPEGGTLTFSTRLAVATSNAGTANGARSELMRISITDTGEGMIPEVASRVFEPFFTTKERGTGLGLSSTHAFVHRSGGSISLRSTPGAGTTVDIVFPCAGVATPAIPVAAAHTSEYVGRTILVVEDDPAVRSVTRSTLLSRGFRVLEAADGPGALAILDANPAIDLVFSDIRMPGGMSGIDLARLLRGRSPALPVLLTSAYAAEFTHGERHEGEGLRILRKPYDDGQLVRWICEALAGRIGAPADARHYEPALPSTPMSR